MALRSSSATVTPAIATPANNSGARAQPNVSTVGAIAIGPNRFPMFKTALVLRQSEAGAGIIVPHFLQVRCASES